MAPPTPFSLATCHLSHPIAPSRPLQDVAKLTKEVKAIADMTSNPPMAMAGLMVGSTQPVAAGMSQLERDIQTMVSHDGVRMLGRSVATRPNVHPLAHLLSVLMAHPWIATDNTTFSRSRGYLILDFLTLCQPQPVIRR